MSQHIAPRRISDAELFLKKGGERKKEKGETQKEPAAYGASPPLLGSIKPSARFPENPCRFLSRRQHLSRLNKRT